MNNSKRSLVNAIEWRDDQNLYLLDQRQLPEQVVFQRCDSADDVANAIRSMQVRGAPAIGIAAAFGVVLAARQHYPSNPDRWQAAIEPALQQLAKMRPTAVNLCWALEQMRAECQLIEQGNPVPQLLHRAQTIHQNDIANNRRMGQLGADYLQGANGVLTHCNAGALATGGYGTALGVIRTAYAAELKEVFSCETRPWLQGARLTVWELAQDKIPVTLIADSAAAWLMRSGRVQWLIVGADRIADNGDVANKIGTYGLAIIARHHGVKMMVVAPTSTIDWQCESAQAIAIEQRDADELLPHCYQQQDSLVDAWNPVFDVTPAGLIDLIVTEHGVVENPDRQAMAQLKLNADRATAD